MQSQSPATVYPDLVWGRAAKPKFLLGEHVEAISVRFGCDLVLAPAEGEPAVGDVEREVLVHFVFCRSRPTASPILAASRLAGFQATVAAMRSS
jgi:hypothetical protein